MVIAIKLPFDLQERFACFPFLHALRSLYPEADFHLITPQKNIEILNLLPFSAFYHEFEENEIRTVFDVHRFCVNAPIFNVDIFVSLTDSFSDACIGWSLKAKTRLGFSDGWKTLVLNQKTPRLKNHHQSEDFLDLYRVHAGKAVDPLLKIGSRGLPYIIEDHDNRPYLAINLSPLRGSQIEQEWKELCSLFRDQRIIFFASEDQDKVSLMIQPFLDSLPPQNDYLFFRYPSWIELGKLLAYARGVITFNGPAASLSAYVGSKTLILFDRQDPRRTAPFYFDGELNIMEASDPGVTQFAETSHESLKPRQRFSMTQVFERGMKFFNLPYRAIP